MRSTFMQKVLICMIAAFFAACLIQWGKIFVEGADDALNAGYNKRDAGSAHRSLTRKPLPSAVAQLTCERSMKIGIAQINPTVGDLRGNFEKILAAYERLAAAGAELVVAPELAITGYPPQDLVFKSRFVPQNLEVTRAPAPMPRRRPAPGRLR